MPISRNWLWHRSMHWHRLYVRLSLSNLPLTRRRSDRPPPTPLRHDVNATPRRIFRVDKVTRTSSVGVRRDVVGTSYVTETLTGLEHQRRDLTWQRAIKNGRIPDPILSTIFWFLFLFMCWYSWRLSSFKKTISNIDLAELRIYVPVRLYSGFLGVIS